MGVMAESMVGYAQPLIDQTDGSLEQVNKALALAQLCWNAALFPEEERERLFADMRPVLKMDDDEFEEFRRQIVLPMILRHFDMFPHMPRIQSKEVVTARKRPQVTVREEKYLGTGRNEPCPCNSGKKHKKCCGR